MLGVMQSGRSLSPYLEFPPRTRYIAHADFSWYAFLLFCLIILAVLSSAAAYIFQSQPDRQKVEAKGAFPRWGWAGAVLGIAAWILAWTRFPWLSACQPHTFTPLWMSYILVVNGIDRRASGSCLMCDNPGYFFALFPLSACFWWFFEYLNRFVQNWYYVGVDFPAWEYFWYATLPFSTVLAAVLSTRECLDRRLRKRIRLILPSIPSRPRSRLPALLLLIASGAGLYGIGILPDYLFPLLWVSPLLIIVGLQSLAGEPHIFDPSENRNGSILVSSALAGLICGFFWEMWNYFSLAKWEYSIPFVNRFRIFEMPILGYAGYLPFGLECTVIGEMISPRQKRVE